MYTTLNKIREHSPCTDGWEKLLKYLGKTKPDDEPLPLLTILNSNGFDHALWCFRAVDGFEKEKLRLGIGFAREVEHLMPAGSKKSLYVFERYAKGLTTQEEFTAAADAARSAAAAAAAAADAAADAARAAAWAADADAAAAAAYAHAVAARSAARSAADAAADVAWAADAAADAAWVAAYSADAARSAAWAAANATRSTIKAKQEAQLRELLEKTCTQL